MLRSALVRHSVAAVAAATLIAGIGPLTFTAGAAESGAVFPATPAAQPRDVVPLSAGPAGYLRYEQGRGQFWSTWGGATEPIRNNTEGPEADGTYGAGSDIVAALRDSGSDGKEVRLFDAARKSNSYLRLPSGHRYIGAFGSTVLTSTGNGTTAPVTWHLLRLVSGSVQDTVVTGWPEGAQPAAGATAGDAKGLLASYTLAGVVSPVWIDLASARVRPLPVDSSPGTASIVHTPTEIVRWSTDGTVLFHTKGAPGSSGPLTLDASAELPYREGDELLGLVGERLIVARRTADGGSASHRLVSVPRTGGEEVPLFASARTRAMAAPDGGLLVVAGTAPDALSLQRLRADGPQVAATVLTAVAPLTSEPQTLGFTHGRLDSLERMPDERYAFRTRSVSVTGELEAGATAERGTLGFPLDACAVDVSDCPEVFSTGDGRVVVQSLPAFDKVPVVVEDRASAGRPLTGDFDGFHLTDVSGRYAVGIGYREDGSRVSAASVDLDTGEHLADFPVGYDPQDLDLQGDTLWVAGPALGTVAGYDVRTGAVRRTVDLGNGCRAEFIRVTGHWLSWTCAGSDYAAGVRDLDTGRDVYLSEPVSELGDGYTVWNRGDDIRITDLRGSEPVLSGTYRPSADNDRTGPYAVDTATGRIAYQKNPAGDIQVADIGVTASPLGRIDADVPATAGVRNAAWTPRWWLTKPAASWTLELRHKATGAVVRSLTGGEARGIVRPSWDGRDAAGRLVANGGYTWTLTAKPADGQGADLVLTGGVTVTGASPVRRDLGDDGFGDLLVQDKAGLVSQYRGNGTGGVLARQAGGTFATDAYPVPFGDVDGDRCNDVLVRLGNDLRAYRPGCGKVLSPASPYTAIGSGWAQYDQLTSPGDVNGDGFQDLVARHASTGDVYFYAGSASHKLAGRVRIGTDWKTYTKISGVGDLNGDGRGDLLGIDTAGALWRYYGTATGGVTARVKLATGWGGYTSVAGVGDISGDGKPELVGRTGDGRLYRHSATGNGTLAARVQIGTSGWQAFKGLY
ncbi:FG-GAP-like repeat-containing protein [Streptomyces zhihengii]